MNEAQLEKQRINRKKTGNATTKKYEKTRNGFLMRTYRNMKSRVCGVTKNKNHLYLGLSLLDKNVFYEFSKSNLVFNQLYIEWVKSGYQRSLTPSVDRIDSSKGYDIDNIQWLTFAENSIKGLKSRWLKVKQTLAHTDQYSQNQVDN